MTVALIGGGGIAEGIACAVPDCQIVADVDVTRQESVDWWFHRCSPAAVVITAGVSCPAPVADPSAKWAHEIDVNLTGSFRVAAAAITEGVGTLIFVASVAGLHGKPNHAGYSASKAGLISLAQSLAFEGHNAYAISPGRVDTPMREKDYPGEDPRTRLTPLQVGEVVADIIDGRYEPGDNIVIRKKGFETFVTVDKGEQWRTELRIGQPPLV